MIRVRFRVRPGIRGWGLYLTRTLGTGLGLLCRSSPVPPVMEVLSIHQCSSQSCTPRFRDYRVFWNCFNDLGDPGVEEVGV